MFKNLFRRMCAPFVLYFICFFIDRKYIAGRYFEESYIGYGWAIKTIWYRNILRLAKPSKLPVHSGCIVSNPDNIIFHPDDLHIFQVPGTYYQNFKAKIYIGKGSYIAPNVGIITANHLFGDLDNHVDGEDIVLGEKCWVGMNSVILPGVVLGPNSVVAAGSVVTKSYPEGSVILGGTPAKVIKTLNT
ncbi:acyltransferase [Aeromonas caviae]|uniref:acyltransferase n=1 Tax=Aeromonas caviae TaxID=648 RepID=UPI001D0A906F|nr:acyltransferase [Aeromonas caviae]UDN25711.1 acyltransferase [Aeromonas caviae]